MPSLIKVLYASGIPFLSATVFIFTTFAQVWTFPEVGKMENSICKFLYSESLFVSFTSELGVFS